MTFAFYLWRGDWARDLATYWERDAPKTPTQHKSAATGSTAITNIPLDSSADGVSDADLRKFQFRFVGGHFSTFPILLESGVGVFRT